MKNTLRAGVCAAALALVAPAASHAGDMNQGWYISMFGGVSNAHNLEGKFTIIGAPFTEKDKMKTGPTFGLALGKAITENLRGELEFAFARHKLKSSVVTNSTAAAPYTPGGGLKSYTILGNLWYDFNNASAFTPYVGGGLGLGIVDSNMTATNFGTIFRNDSTTGFAFQLGTGVNYALSPSVSIGLGYRFKGIVGFDLKQAGFATTTYKGLDLYTHNFLANVTFKFGGP